MADNKMKNRPSKILARLLDPTARWDYLGLFLLALWPIVYARIIGAHATLCGVALEDVSNSPGVCPKNQLYDGYWDRPNWTWYVVLLPLILFLMRWIMERIAPVRSRQPGGTLPPIIHLVKSARGQEAAYTALRNHLLSRNNLWMVITIAVVITVVDMRELLSYYFGAAVGAEDERDWALMFSIENEVAPTIGENLVLVASAYPLQILLVLFLFLLAILVTQHNLFFLRRVFQRRAVPEDRAEEYITIDLDDVNNCFGFRQANQAFNVQVLFLAMIGTGLLVSRFLNVVKNRELFPDAGQVIMTIGWFAGLFIVALPVWVKMLPRLPGRGKTPEISIVTYLREFFPEKRWPYGDNPDDKVVDTLAGRFAINAFWPTGNNRAKTVFFLSFLAACYLVVPPPILNVSDADRIPDWARNLWLVMPVSLVVYSVIAVALTALLLWSVSRVLNYVDERLVTPSEGPVMTIAELNKSLGVESEKENIGIFISYRRSDSAGYTGRLKENLDRHIYKERIFYDLHTVDAGTDFVEKIEHGIDASDVMLVVIGPDWLWSVDENGQEQKYGGPKGYVIFEIVGAISRKVPIIPVLVGGVQMPNTDELPAEIAMLSRYQAVEITDLRWAYDFDRLVEGILKFRKETDLEAGK